MIRVLIADDEPPARRKVRRFLEHDPEIGEIQEAGSGEQALAVLRTFAPDLVFLDVQMPGMDGFTALAAAPEPRDFYVIFLTAHEHYALRAFQAEALGYLLKPVDLERFERALERAKEQVALRRERKGQPEAPRHFSKRLLVQKAGREIFLPLLPTETMCNCMPVRKPTPFAARWRISRSNSIPISSFGSIAPSW
jgi:YesN/AraC family two-component response regulator